MARLHREVVDKLLSRIIEGRYEVGSMLPKEEDLAAEFGVARGTAREALRALEERNVTTVKHGRGATVHPLEEWNVLDEVVARALGAGRGRRAFMTEVSEYRRMLESEAAALAAARAPARQREQIRAAAARLPETGDSEHLRRLIVGAARNRPLAATLRALAHSGERPATQPTPDALARLANLVADGDSDAARDAAASMT